NLAEPVSDVDDRCPFRGELADGVEEALDGILRERRGRLVEDQQLRGYGECLGQLEQVPTGDAERGHAVFEMTVEVDVVEQRAHRLRCIRIATPQVLGGDGYPDVL